MASAGEKIIKWSFWLIAAIHILVFSVIGAATQQWRLLAIFLVGFVVVLTVWACIKIGLAQKKKRVKSNGNS